MRFGPSVAALPARSGSPKIRKIERFKTQIRHFVACQLKGQGGASKVTTSNHTTATTQPREPHMNATTNIGNKDNFALASILAIGVITIAGSLFTSNDAVAKESTQPAIQKMDVIVVTALRSADAKLSTIVVTASRSSSSRTRSA